MGGTWGYRLRLCLDSANQFTGSGWATRNANGRKPLRSGEACARQVDRVAKDFCGASGARRNNHSIAVADENCSVTRGRYSGSSAQNRVPKWGLKRECVVLQRRPSVGPNIPDPAFAA